MPMMRLMVKPLPLGGLHRFADFDDFACALVINKAQRWIGKCWNVSGTVFETRSDVVCRDVIDWASKSRPERRKQPATRVIKTHIIQCAFAKRDATAVASWCPAGGRARDGDKDRNRRDVSTIRAGSDVRSTGRRDLRTTSQLPGTLQ